MSVTMRMHASFLLALMLAMVGYTGVASAEVKPLRGDVSIDSDSASTEVKSYLKGTGRSLATACSSHRLR